MTRRNAREQSVYPFIALGLLTLMSGCGRSADETVTVGITASSSTDLPLAVHELLTEHCDACHGKLTRRANLNVLDPNQLARYIEPGVPEESELWRRITSTDPDERMPRDGPLDQESQELVRQWIVSGAEFASNAARFPRQEVNLREVYRWVREDLRSIPEENREDIRYLTVAHLHNNREVSDEDLVRFRLALLRIVNSLSWRPYLIDLPAVDPQQTIFRLDLVDVGWDHYETPFWQQLIKRYPYAMRYDFVEDESLAEFASEVYDETQTIFPILRADWFVATASHGELYYEALDLPRTAFELERELGVEFDVDFQKNRIARGAVNQSEVTHHNRVLDRHWTKFGAYWRSWDFGSSQDQANVIRLPLGPAGPHNQYRDLAFQQDGGEIIFELPNGLHGFMLVDGNGQRIATGPSDIVHDQTNVLGTGVVTNAISCMTCHSRGFRRFDDIVRNSFEGTEEQRRKVHLIYPTQERLDRLIAEDNQRFANTVDRLTRMLPTQGLPENEDLAAAVETIVRFYHEPLGLADVTAELGCNEDHLRKIANHAELSNLRPVLQGDVIPRAQWEARDTRSDDTLSTHFQKAMRRYLPNSIPSDSS